MSGWVHANKTGSVAPPALNAQCIKHRLIEDSDITLRRKNFVIFFDLHNVVKFRHRPISSKHTVFAVVDGIFCAQSFEIGLPLVLLQQYRMTHIHIFNRHGFGVWQLSSVKYHFAHFLGPSVGFCDLLS